MNDTQDEIEIIVEEKPDTLAEQAAEQFEAQI